MKNVLLTILAVVAANATTLAGEVPQAGSPTTLQARCDSLYEQCMTAFQAWADANRKAQTTEEAQQHRRPDGAEYAAKFLAMAREQPEDPAAVDALTRAIAVDPFGASYAEALERLSARHARSPKIGAVLTTLAFDATSPRVEPFLRAVLADNPDVEVRARAALALAGHLRRIAGESEHMRRDPASFAFAISNGGAEAAERIRDRDPAALRREAESLLEILAGEYADISFDEQRGITFGQHAATLLHEIRELVVGKPAPEIEGHDVDGNPLRLSDYRGKVVALVWWASWCGNCMAMVPHERKLVRRLEGEPFVLLGVNGDENRSRARHEMQANGITWRSWYDGGPDGTISTAWNVTGWPTVYVLDPEGVIRYKGHRSEEDLDLAIDTLLEEMETAAGGPG